MAESPFPIFLPVLALKVLLGATETQTPAHCSLSWSCEDKYVSRDLDVLAPRVRELISAFYLSMDASWLSWLDLP